MARLRKSLTAVMLFVLSTPRPGGARTDDAQITVGVSSNAPAFEAAVGAFKIALGEDSAHVVFVQLDGKDRSKSLTGAQPHLAVAFGSRAVDAFTSSNPAV